VRVTVADKVIKENGEPTTGGKAERRRLKKIGNGKSKWLVTRKSDRAQRRDAKRRQEAMARVVVAGGTAATSNMREPPLILDADDLTDPERRFLESQIPAAKESLRAGDVETGTPGTDLLGRDDG
jgi:hypothetical protein